MCLYEKRFSKYLTSRKTDFFFWKINVHQRFWYTMRNVIAKLAPSYLTIVKVIDRLSVFW